MYLGTLFSICIVITGAFWAWLNTKSGKKWLGEEE
jgi:hypothetical protein